MIERRANPTVIDHDIVGVAPMVPPVQAETRRMSAQWTIEDTRITPEWIRSQAALYRKAADELDEVAEFMEENDVVLG